MFAQFVHLVTVPHLVISRDLYSGTVEWPKGNYYYNLTIQNMILVMEVLYTIVKNKQV